MKGFEVVILQQVQSDIAEAFNWYEEQEFELGDRFLKAVEAGLRAIEKAPWRYPFFLEGIRRILLGRFPYLIAYRIIDRKVVVLAVMHNKRDPQLLEIRDEKLK